MPNLPNVHFLPRVDCKELPNFAAGFDICVLSCVTEHTYTSYGSAIKVREYLATGKPVVIAPLPEYERMSDVLQIARNRDEFMRLIDVALQDKNPENKILRQNAVKNGTWDDRAGWVNDLIETKLQEKNRAFFI